MGERDIVRYLDTHAHKAPAGQVVCEWAHVMEALAMQREQYGGRIKALEEELRGARQASAAVCRHRDGLLDQIAELESEFKIPDQVIFTDVMGCHEHSFPRSMYDRREKASEERTKALEDALRQVHADLKAYEVAGILRPGSSGYTKEKLEELGLVL